MQKRFDEVKKNISLPMNMEIINQHSEILEYDIKGIPSIMIDNQVVIEGRMPSTNELSESIREFQKNVKPMKTDIEKILVPIDNSATAISALKYALDYSRINNASIDILHVCSFSFDHTLNEIPGSIEELKDQKIKSIKSKLMDLFGDNIPNLLCEVGYPIDVIKENSKDYDLIIMGSTGNHGFVDKLLGSISSGVAQHAHCPVLLIPKEQETVSFDKTLCACQPQKIDVNLLERLFEISPNNSFSEIHFIEIVKKNQEANSKNIKQIIEEIQGGSDNNIHYFIDEIEGDSVTESLDEYAQKNDIGVIVMTTHHRTSLEALFHKSTTKQMVLDIKIPLLILHIED